MRQNYDKTISFTAYRRAKRAAANLHPKIELHFIAECRM